MRMSSGNSTRNNSSEENPYWISFSDLMSALLVIFILASVALIIELTQRTNEIDKSIKEIQKSEQVRFEILNDIKSELEEKNIKVEVSENHSVLRIPEDTLSFASGSEKIPDNQKTQKIVREIGTILHKEVIENNRFEYLDTIFIEGHTDSHNIHYRGKGNWGLSTDRAISLWKLWSEEIDLSPPMGALQNSEGKKLFSVSGYAATRRYQEIEDLPEQRAKNRRIDIRFTIKRPTIVELEQIRANALGFKEGQ